MQVMKKLDVSVGQRFRDDDGDLVTVRKVNRGRGLVVLEGKRGSYEMDLDSLREAVDNEEFEQIPDDEDG
jgi:hypothetical protein